MKSIGLLAYIALVSAEATTSTETAAKHPVDYNHYPIKEVVAPTISTLPHKYLPHPVVITLKSYPDEIEWTITGSGAAAGITCGNGPYDGHYGEQPAEDCKLKAGDYTLKCIDTYGDGWHGGFMTIDGTMYCDYFTTGHLMTKTFSECADPLEISQKELDVQLDYFSRSFDKFHYENAMNIYAEMKKQGKEPVTGPSGVHTWELYDKAFPFRRSEDTTSSNNIWMPSNISRITLTRTSKTDKLSTNSSLSDLLLKLLSTPNITMVNSAIQLFTTQ